MTSAGLTGGGRFAMASSPVPSRQSSSNRAAIAIVCPRCQRDYPVHFVPRSEVKYYSRIQRAKILTESLHYIPLQRVGPLKRGNDGNLGRTDRQYHDIAH